LILLCFVTSRRAKLVLLVIMNGLLLMAAIGPEIL